MIDGQNNTQSVGNTQNIPSEPKKQVVKFGESLILNGATMQDIASMPFEAELESLESFTKVVKSKMPEMDHKIIAEQYNQVKPIFDQYKTNENYIKNTLSYPVTSDDYRNLSKGAKVEIEKSGGYHYTPGLPAYQKFTDEQVARIENQGRYLDIDGQMKYGIPDVGMRKNKLAVTVFDENHGPITKVVPYNIQQPEGIVQSFFGMRKMESNSLLSLAKGFSSGVGAKSAIGLTSIPAVVEDAINFMLPLERSATGGPFNKFNNSVTNMFSGTLAKNQDEQEGVFDNLNSFLYQFADGIGQVYGMSMFSKAAFGTITGFQKAKNAATAGMDASRLYASNSAMQLGLYFGAAQAGGMMRNMAIQQGVNPYTASLMFVPWALGTFMSERLFMSNVFLRNAIGLDKFQKQTGNLYAQLLGKPIPKGLPAFQRKAGETLVKSWYRGIDDMIGKMGKNKYGKYLAMGIEEGIEEMGEGFMHYPVDHLVNWLAASQAENTIMNYGNHKYESVLLPNGTLQYERVTPNQERQVLDYQTWSAGKEDLERSYRWRAGDKPLEPEFWNWDEALLAAISTPFGGGLASIGNKAHKSKEANERKLFAQEIAVDIAKKSLKNGQLDPMILDSSIEAIKNDLANTLKNDPSMMGPGVMVDGKNVRDAEIQLIGDEIRLMAQFAHKYGIMFAEGLQENIIGQSLIREAYQMAEQYERLEKHLNEINTVEEGTKIAPESYIENITSEKNTKEENVIALQEAMAAQKKVLDDYLLPENSKKKTSRIYSDRLADMHIQDIVRSEIAKAELEKEYTKKGIKKEGSDKKKYLEGRAAYVETMLDSKKQELAKTLRQDYLNNLTKFHMGDVHMNAYIEGYVSPTQFYKQRLEAITQGIKNSIEEYNAQQLNEIQKKNAIKDVSETIVDDVSDSLQDILGKDTNLSNIDDKLSDIQKNIANLVKRSKWESSAAKLDSKFEERAGLFSGQVAQIRKIYDNQKQALLEKIENEERVRGEALVGQTDFTLEEAFNEELLEYNPVTYEKLVEQSPEVQQKIREAGVKSAWLDYWLKPVIDSKGNMSYEAANIEQKVNDIYNRVITEGKTIEGDINDTINELFYLQSIINKNILPFLGIVEYWNKGDKELSELANMDMSEHNPRKSLTGDAVMSDNEVSSIRDIVSGLTDKIDNIFKSDSFKAYDKQKSESKVAIKTVLTRAMLAYEIAYSPAAIEGLVNKLKEIYGQALEARGVKEANNDFTLDGVPETYTHLMTHLFNLDVEQTKNKLIEIEREVVKVLDSITDEKVIENYLSTLKSQTKEYKENRDLQYIALDEYSKKGSVNIKASNTIIDNEKYVTSPEQLHAKSLRRKEHMAEYLSERWSLALQLQRLAKKGIKYSSIYNELNTHLKNNQNNGILPYSKEQQYALIHTAIFLLNPETIKIYGEKIERDITDHNIFYLSGVGGSGKSSIILDAISIYKAITKTDKKIGITIITPTGALNEEHIQRSKMYGKDLDVTTMTVYEYKNDKSKRDSINDLVIFDEATALSMEITGEAKNSKESPHHVYNLASEKEKANKNYRILLIGDVSQVAQAESLSFSAPRIAKERTNPLTMVHRSANESVLAFSEMFQDMFLGGNWNFNPKTNMISPKGKGVFEGATLEDGSKEGVFLAKSMEQVYKEFKAARDANKNAMLIFLTEQQRENFLKSNSEYESLSNYIKVLELKEDILENNMVSGLSGDMIFIGYDMFEVANEKNSHWANSVIYPNKLTKAREGYTAVTRTKNAGFVMFHTSTYAELDNTFVEIKREKSFFKPITDLKERVKGTINELNKVLEKNEQDGIVVDEVVETVVKEKQGSEEVTIDRNMVIFDVSKIKEQEEFVKGLPKLNYANRGENRSITSLMPAKPESTGENNVNQQDLELQLIDIIENNYEGATVALSPEYGANVFSPKLVAKIGDETIEGHPFLIKVVGKTKQGENVLPIVDIYIKKVMNKGLADGLSKYDEQRLATYAILARKNGMVVNKLAAINFKSYSEKNYEAEKKKAIEIEGYGAKQYYIPAKDWSYTMSEEAIGETIVELLKDTTLKALIGENLQSKDFRASQEDILYTERVVPHHNDLLMNRQYYNKDTKEVIKLDSTNAKVLLKIEKGEPVYKLAINGDIVGNLNEWVENNRILSELVQFRTSALMFTQKNALYTIGTHMPKRISDVLDGTIGNSEKFNPEKNPYIKRKQDIYNLITEILKEGESVPVIIKYIENNDNVGNVDKAKHNIQVSIDLEKLTNIASDNDAIMHQQLFELFKLTDDLIKLEVNDNDLQILGYHRAVEIDYGQGNNEYTKGVPMTEQDITDYLTDPSKRAEIEAKVSFSNNVNDVNQIDNKQYNVDKLKNLLYLKEAGQVKSEITETTEGYVNYKDSVIELSENNIQFFKDMLARSGFVLESDTVIQETVVRKNYKRVTYHVEANRIKGVDKEGKIIINPLSKVKIEVKPKTVSTSQLKQYIANSEKQIEKINEEYDAAIKAHGIVDKTTLPNFHAKFAEETELFKFLQMNRFLLKEVIEKSNPLHTLFSIKENNKEDKGYNFKVFGYNSGEKIKAMKLIANHLLEMIDNGAILELYDNVYESAGNPKIEFFTTNFSEVSQPNYGTRLINKGEVNKESETKTNEIDPFNGMFPDDENMALPVNVNKKTNIKAGVEELFDSNSELANIGTQEQYSQYLDTIFPDSKVKDIVYHGTDTKFDKFDKAKIGSKTGYPGRQDGLPKGFYFTKDIEIAKTEWGNILIPVLLNIKNPQIINNWLFHNILDSVGFIMTENRYNRTHQNWKDTIINKHGEELLIVNKNTDSFIIEKENYPQPQDIRFRQEQYVIISENQIHILGGKQDIEGFKEYVANKDTKLAREVSLTQTEAQVKEQIQQVLGKKNMKYVDAFSDLIMKNKHDERVMGRLENFRIKLFGENGMYQENVGRHEAMHFILRHLLTPAERTAVINSAKKEMPSNYELSVDEYIAEQFETHVPNNKPKTIFRQFVDALKRFFNWVGIYQYGFYDFMDNADRGAYANRTINNVPVHIVEDMRVENRYNTAEAISEVENILPTLELQVIAKDTLMRFIHNASVLSKEVYKDGVSFTQAMVDVRDDINKIYLSLLKYKINDKSVVDMSYEDLMKEVKEGKDTLKYMHYYSVGALRSKNIFANLLQQIYPGLDYESLERGVYAWKNDIGQVHGKDNESKNPDAVVTPEVKHMLSRIPKYAKNDKGVYQNRGYLEYSAVSSEIKKIITSLGQRMNSNYITFTDILEEMDMRSNAKDVSNYKKDLYNNFLWEFGYRKRPIPKDEAGKPVMPRFLGFGKRLMIQEKDNKVYEQFKDQVEKRMKTWIDIENAITFQFSSIVSKSYVKADINTGKSIEKGIRTSNDVKKKMQDELQNKYFSQTGEVTQEAKDLMSTMNIEVKGEYVDKYQLKHKDGPIELYQSNVMQLRHNMQLLGLPFYDKITIDDINTIEKFNAILMQMFISLKYNVEAQALIQKENATPQNLNALKELIFTKGSEQLQALYNYIYKYKKLDGVQESAEGVSVFGESKETVDTSSNKVFSGMVKPHNFWKFITDLAEKAYEAEKFHDSEVTMFGAKSFNNYNTTSNLDVVLKNKGTVDSKIAEINEGVVVSGVQSAIAKIIDGKLKVNNSILKTINDNHRVKILKHHTLLGTEYKQDENTSKQLTSADLLKTLFDVLALDKMITSNQEEITLILSPFADKSRKEVVTISIEGISNKTISNQKMIIDSTLNMRPIIDMTNEIVNYYSDLRDIAQEQYKAIFAALGLDYIAYKESDKVAITATQVGFIKSLPQVDISDYIIAKEDGQFYLKPGNNITLTNTLFDNNFIDEWNKQGSKKESLIKNLIDQQSKELFKYMEEVNYSPSSRLKNYYKENNKGLEVTENHPAVQAITAYTLLLNESFSHINRGPATSFKTVVDMVKRSAKDVAPFMQIPMGIEGGMKTSFNAVHIEPLGVFSPTINEHIKELLDDGYVRQSALTLRRMQKSTGGEFSLIKSGVIKLVYTNYDMLSARNYYFKMSSQAATEVELFDNRSKHWREAEKFMMGEQMFAELEDMVVNKKIAYGEALDILIAKQDANPEAYKTIDMLVPSSAMKTQQSNRVMYGSKEGTDPFSKTLDNTTMPLRGEENDNQILTLPTEGLGLQSLTQKGMTDRNKPLPIQIVRLVKNFLHNSEKASLIEKMLAENVEEAIQKFHRISNSENTEEFKNYLVSLARKNLNKDNVSKRDIIASSKSFDINAAMSKHIENIIKVFNEAFKISMTGMDTIQVPSLTYYYEGADGMLYTAGDLGLIDDSYTKDGYKRRQIQSRHYEADGKWLNETEVKATPNAKFIPEEVVMDFPFRKQFGLSEKTSLKKAMTFAGISMYQKYSNRKSYTEVYNQISEIVIDKQPQDVVALLSLIEDKGISDTIAERARQKYEDLKTEEEKKAYTKDVIKNTVETIATYYTQFNNALDTMVVRVPSGGAESASTARIVRFNYAVNNAVEKPAMSNNHDGSDFDNDPLQVYFRSLTKQGAIDNKGAAARSNNIFEVLYSYYNDNRNSDLILAHTSKENTKKFLEDNTGAIKYFDYANDLSSILTSMDIGKSGVNLVGHFANMLVFMSDFNGMNIDAMMAGLSDNLKSFIIVDGKVEYVGNAEEHMKVSLQFIGELLQLAVDNVNEAGVLGRLNINENNTNFIAGMVLLANKAEYPNLTNSILTALSSPVMIRASKIVENSKKLEYTQGRKQLTEAIETALEIEKVQEAKKKKLFETEEKFTEAFVNVSIKVKEIMPLIYEEYLIKQQERIEKEKTTLSKMQNKLSELEKAEIRDEVKIYNQKWGIDEMKQSIDNTETGLKKFIETVLNSNNPTQDIYEKMYKPDGTYEMFILFLQDRLAKATTDAKKMKALNLVDMNKYTKEFNSFTKNEVVNGIDLTEINLWVKAARIGEQFKRLGFFSSFLSEIDGTREGLQQAISTAIFNMGFATIEEAVKWLNTDTMIKHETEAQIAHLTRGELRKAKDGKITEETLIRNTGINIAHIVYHNPLYKQYILALAQMKSIIEEKFIEANDKKLRGIIEANVKVSRFSDNHKAINNAISKVYEGAVIQQIIKEVISEDGSINIDGITSMPNVDLTTPQGIQSFLTDFITVHELIQKQKDIGDTKFLRTLSTTIRQDGFKVIEMINSKSVSAEDKQFIKTAFNKLSPKIQNIYALYHLLAFGRATNNGTFYEFINPSIVESRLNTENLTSIQKQIESDLEKKDNLLLTILQYNTDLELRNSKRDSDTPRDDKRDKYERVTTDNNYPVGILRTENSETKYYYKTLPLRINPHILPLDANLTPAISENNFIHFHGDYIKKIKSGEEVEIVTYNKTMPIYRSRQEQYQPQLGDVVNTLAGPVKLLREGKRISGYRTLESVVVKLIDSKISQLKPMLNKRSAAGVLEAFLSVAQSAFPNINFVANNNIVGYGEIINGEYHYNPDIVTLETHIHELGHIHILLMQQLNPGLYAKAMQEAINMVNNNHPIYQVIKNQRGYDEYQGDKLLHEIIATFIGMNGVSKVENYIQTNNLLGETGFAQKLYNGIKSIVRSINDFVKGFFKAFGLNITPNSTLKSITEEFIGALMNNEYYSTVDTGMLRDLMFAAGYNQISHLNTDKINNVAEFTNLVNADRKIADIVKLDEQFEINQKIKEIQNNEGNKYITDEGVEYSFGSKPVSEWTSDIKKILQHEKNAGNKLTNQTLEALKLGGSLMDFNSIFGQKKDGEQRYSSDVITQLRRAMLVSNLMKPTYMKYSDLEKHENLDLRALYNDKLVGDNPIIAVYETTINDVKKYNVSIYQITNERYSNAQTHEGNKILGNLESRSTMRGYGLNLQNNYRDITHVKLMLLANHLAGSNPNIAVDQAGIIQLFPNQVRPLLTERQHFSKQLDAMLKSDKFKEKLSPEMLKLFQSKAYRDSNYDYSDFLLEFYKRDGWKYRLEGLDIESFHDMPTYLKVDVIKARLAQIHSEVVNNNMTNAQSAESVFLTKSLLALESKGMPRERLDSWGDLSTSNLWASPQYNVPHEALSYVIAKGNLSQQRVVEKIIQFNKNGFDNFVDYFRGNIKIESLDTSYKSYEPLFVYEQAKDKEGNTHNIWTGRVAWTTDQNLDPIGYKKAQELSLTSEGQKTLAQGKWLVEQITEMYAKLIVHNYHKKGWKMTIEEATDILNGKNNKRKFAYTPGVIPWMGQTISEMLGKSNIKEAMSKATEFLGNSMMAFDEVSDMMTDNKDGLNFLDELPNLFYDQIAVGEESLGYDKYGKENLLLKNLGLYYDGKSLHVLDMSKQKTISRDLEAIMKMFMMTMERKIEYEKNVLPVMNGVRSLLNMMNEAYAGDQMFEQENTLNFLNAYTRQTILGKREKIKGTLVGTNISLDKAIAKTTGMASAAVMTWNMMVGQLSFAHNGMTAWIEGISGSIISRMSESGEGVYFTASNLAKGSADAIANMGLLSQLGMDNQIFNATDYEFATHQIHQKGKKHFFGEHSNNWFNWAADYYARAVTMSAYMKTMGIRDAVTINEKGEVIYDELKDKRYFTDGKREQTPEQKARYKMAKEMMIEEGIMTSMEEAITRPFTFQEARMIRTVASNYITGAYSRNEKNMLGTIFVGKLFGTFKTFFMSKYTNAIRKGGYSQDLGFVEYTKDDNGNVVAKWQRAYTEGYINTVIKAMSDIFSKDEKVFSKEYWTQNPHRMRNLVRLGSTLTTFLLSSLLYSLLVGSKEDDKPIPEIRTIKNFKYAYESLLVLPMLFKMLGTDSTFAAFSILNRTFNALLEGDMKAFARTLPGYNFVYTTPRDIQILAETIIEE